jgi:hypothetical protein
MKIVESLVLLSNMDYVVCFRHSRSLEGHWRHWCPDGRGKVCQENADMKPAGVIAGPFDSFSVPAYYSLIVKRGESSLGSVLFTSVAVQTVIPIFHVRGEVFATQRCSFRSDVQFWHC